MNPGKRQVDLRQRGCQRAPPSRRPQRKIRAPLIEVLTCERLRQTGGVRIHRLACARTTTGPASGTPCPGDRCIRRWRARPPRATWYSATRPATSPVRSYASASCRCAAGSPGISRTACFEFRRGLPGPAERQQATCPPAVARGPKDGSSREAARNSTSASALRPRCCRTMPRLWCTKARSPPAARTSRNAASAASRLPALSASTPVGEAIGERRRQILRGAARRGDEQSDRRAESRRAAEHALKQKGRRARAGRDAAAPSRAEAPPPPVRTRTATAICIVRGSVTEPFHLPKSGLARSLLNARPCSHSPRVREHVPVPHVEDLEPELEVGAAAHPGVLDERQVLVVVAEARGRCPRSGCPCRSRS